MSQHPEKQIGFHGTTQTRENVRENPCRLSTSNIEHQNTQLRRAVYVNNSNSAAAYAATTAD